jgi:hypothetical protein
MQLQSRQSFGKAFVSQSKNPQQGAQSDDPFSERETLVSRQPERRRFRPDAELREQRQALEREWAQQRVE